MKKAFLFLAVVVTFLSPAIASAQALPSLGIVFGRSAVYGESNAAGAGLDFQIGYVGTPRGVRLDLTFDRAFGGVVQNMKQTYPVDGLWLGLAANIPFGDRVTLIASGSWVLSSNGQSDEEYVFPGLVVPGSRNWSTSTHWYTLGLGGAFSIAPSAAFLAGFRYDSFETSFSDPENATFAASLAADEGDFRANFYLPYIGLMVGCGHGRIGFIGFPYVPGEISYLEQGQGFRGAG
jgi:hypothetical protein